MKTQSIILYSILFIVLCFFSFKYESTLAAFCAYCIAIVLLSGIGKNFLREVTKLEHDKENEVL